MIPTYTGYRQLASIDRELADQRYACAVSYQGRIKPGGKRDKRRFGHARNGRTQSPALPCHVHTATNVSTSLDHAPVGLNSDRV